MYPLPGGDRVVDVQPNWTIEAEGSSRFAAAVLRNLLAHITEENVEGTDTFMVSHAWADGPTIYLVYQTPPSTITWGLVRDTRESINRPRPLAFA